MEVSQLDKSHGLNIFLSTKNVHLDRLYFKRKYLKLVIESLGLFRHVGAGDVGAELLEADHPVVVVVDLGQPVAHLDTRQLTEKSTIGMKSSIRKKKFCSCCSCCVRPLWILKCCDMKLLTDDKKYRIRETLNLLACAYSSTNTKKLK